ncbi:hypothetical protein AB2553_14155 [Bacillus mycoides]|uniref:hypothetical protein n=1 Tax=Bacillus mycoides TaxID=1405 RepID=UPI003464313E
MGGRLPSSISSEGIKIEIELLVEKYHLSIKEELDISDIEYLIVIDKIRNINGFPEEDIKASAFTNDEESQIERIVCFTESISRDINRRFSEVTTSSIFKEVVQMYIMFVFIHELIHVQQFKNGMTMKEYNESEYKINRFEKEANDKAEEYLSRFGELQREVAKLINSDEIVNYDIFTKLVDLYNK